MNRFNQFFLLVCLLASAGLSAQSFGVRAGVNATNADVSVSNLDIDTDGETNLMLGLFVDLPLGTELISVQPELNYLNRGYSFTATVGGNEFSRTVSYLELGALLKLNFGRDEGLGFYVGAGPQYGYAVSGTETNINGDRDVDVDFDRINRGQLQFAGVGGLTFGSNFRFFVEARYNGIFADQDGDDSSEIRQRSLGLNGGVMIPLGN